LTVFNQQLLNSLEGIFLVSLLIAWIHRSPITYFQCKKYEKMLIYNCLKYWLYVCVCVCVWERERVRVNVCVCESEKKEIRKKCSLFLFCKHEYQSHDKTILWLSIHKSRYQTRKKEQKLHNKNIFLKLGCSI